MKLLLVTPSAPGLLNHAAALCRRVESASFHTLVVSGPGAEDHFAEIGYRGDCRALPSHNLDFARDQHGRVPHLQQATEEAYLARAAADLDALVQTYAPDILVAKSFIHPMFVARRRGVAFSSYWTGGALHAVPGRSPYLAAFSDKMRTNVELVGRAWLGRAAACVTPERMIQTCLNIVRGLPETSGLSRGTLATLPKNVVFTGFLTYDGEMQATPRPVFTHEHNRLYVTFGTMCFDRRRYEWLAEELQRLSNWETLVTCLRFNPSSLAGPGQRWVKYFPNDIAMRECDVILHHGGHGTVMAALRNGVPQLVMPENRRTSCQDHQGQMIAALDVGVTMDSERLEAGALVAAIASLRAKHCFPRARSLADHLNTLSSRYDAALPDVLREWVRSDGSP